MNVIETSGLGKRYRKTWALRDCTLAVPAGHVVALVGPNGAGKTTLLHCAVGLSTATTGSVTVLGDLAAGSLDALERVAFVAQDAPLHRHLSVRAMLGVARNLNRRFDRGTSRTAPSSARDPTGPQGRQALRRPAGPARSLLGARAPSRPARARRAACSARPARTPRLHGARLTAVAEDGLSVLFSSHVVSELERVADYLILLAHGQVQMAGAIDDLLAGHAMLSGPVEESGSVAEQFPVVQSRTGGSLRTAAHPNRRQVASPERLGVRRRLARRAGPRLPARAVRVDAAGSAQPDGSTARAR